MASTATAAARRSTTKTPFARNFSRPAAHRASKATPGAAGAFNGCLDNPERFKFSLKLIDFKCFKRKVKAKPPAHEKILHLPNSHFGRHASTCVRHSTPNRVGDYVG
jgi:hypothetical protein